MTICKAMHNAIEKRLNEGKDIETIGGELCDGVKHPKKKIINIIKKMNGYGAQYLIENAERLKYDGAGQLKSEKKPKPEIEPPKPEIIPQKSQIEILKEQISALDEKSIDEIFVFLQKMFLISDFDILKPKIYNLDEKSLDEILILIKELKSNKNKENKNKEILIPEIGANIKCGDFVEFLKQIPEIDAVIKFQNNTISAKIINNDNSNFVDIEYPCFCSKEFEFGIDVKNLLQSLKYFNKKDIINIKLNEFRIVISNTNYPESIDLNTIDVSSIQSFISIPKIESIFQKEYITNPSTTIEIDSKDLNKISKILKSKDVYDITFETKDGEFKIRGDGFESIIPAKSIIGNARSIFTKESILNAFKSKFGIAKLSFSDNSPLQIKFLDKNKSFYSIIAQREEI